MISNYTPPQQTNWRGRSDSKPNERFFQCITCIDLQKQTLQQQDSTFAILGFCSDVGIQRNLGRLGAKEGPQALRQALAQLPMHSANKVNIHDLGDIVCVKNDLETAQADLGALINNLLQHHYSPIVLGGGHETAWGHYQGIAAAYPQINLGIINFDAHFDLRPLLKNDQGSSGTPFFQIANARKKNHLPFDYFVIGIQEAANTKSLLQ